MKKIVTLISLFFTTIIYSQNPTITGNFMLCPNSTSTLSTQVYDTYQWKKRDYGSSNAVNIAGEVNQSITIDDYNYTVSYVSVEVTSNGQTFLSPEVFIDGWAFLPIAVQINGNYTINPNNGEVTLVNQSDYVIFTVLDPYDTNIIWYKDGQIIPNQNTSSIQVNEAGVYGVSAAPALCPNYIANSLPLVVQAENLGIENPEFELPTVFPNPTENILQLNSNKNIIKIEVFDLLGKKIMQENNSNKSVDVSSINNGIYVLKIQDEDHKLFYVKFIKN